MLVPQFSLLHRAHSQSCSQQMNELNMVCCVQQPLRAHSEMEESFYFKFMYDCRIFEKRMELQFLAESISHHDMLAHAVQHSTRPASGSIRSSFLLAVVGVGRQAGGV